MDEKKQSKQDSFNPDTEELNDLTDTVEEEEIIEHMFDESIERLEDEDSSDESVSDLI